MVSLFLVIGSNIRMAESFPLEPLNMKLQRILDTSDDDNNMDKSRRSSLLQIIPYCSILLPIVTISSQPIPTNAIEFVPPSPYFMGTYQSAIEIEKLTIETSRHQYTQKYINLTKAFYLKM